MQWPASRYGNTNEMPFSSSFIMERQSFLVGNLSLASAWTGFSYSGMGFYQLLQMYAPCYALQTRFN
jgi:hypothetical protein